MNKLPSNHILVKFLNLKVHTQKKFYKYTEVFKKDEGMLLLLLLHHFSRIRLCATP